MPFEGVNGAGKGGARLGIGEAAWVRGGLVLAAIVVLGLVVLLPLAVLVVGAFAEGAGAFAAALAEPDAQAAIRLSLLVAAIVVPANTVFGLAAAWCLTRFRFPGRAALRAIIALPFSVSPVIAGLVFVLLFGARGWFGGVLSALDVQVIFALPGIVLATMFVTLPFVASQVMPLMAAQGQEEEEASLLLGASGWQMFWRVTLPKVRWSVVYGVLLCSARAMGEFGAVSVVSGRIRGETNTMPLHIEVLYQEYAIASAFSVSLLLAGLALLTIAVRATLEWRQERARLQGSLAQLVVRV